MSAGERLREHRRSLCGLLATCLMCSGTQVRFSGTAPLIFDGNRLYAELAFVRPDGTLRRALAFVDLGSPSAIVSKALFEELQLNQEKFLTFKVGEMPVRVASSTVTSDTWLPYSIGRDRQIEALLPAGVMHKFQVVIDYAAHKLTLAQRGVLKPEGVRSLFA